MNCQNCQQPFNQSSNIPRLLILCGHSLCQSCCNKFHENSKIKCPQCNSFTYVDTISLLPKNLALLNMNGSTTDLNSICIKHNKKYEAFCQKQKILICVDCILLDDHKNHSMQSIKNAYFKQYQKMSKNLNKYNQMLENLSQKYSLNKKNHKESKEIYSNAEQQVQNIFREIHSIIVHEQEQCYVKIQQAYKNVEKKILQKNAKYNKLLENLDQIIDQLKKCGQLSQVEFLRSTQNREEIYSASITDSQQPVKPLALQQNKSHILDSIIKILQKSNKSNASQQKKPQMIHAQVKNKFTKKSSNISNTNQNNQVSNKQLNKKQKVYSKKQPNSITHNQSALTPTNHKNSSEVRHQVKKQNKCDISLVESKQSLYNSFMSGMVSFLNQKKYIYIMGGFNEDNNNVFKLNLNSLVWQEVSAMQSNRSKFGSIVIDKNILIFGGKKGKERVADSQIWNGSWISGYTMPKVKSGFGVINIDNYVYFIGGNDGQQILNNVQCLNLSTGQWKRKQPMHQPRDQLAVVLGNDNKIYAIGGFGGLNNQPLKSVQVYDKNFDKWTFIPPMKFARRALSAAVLADGIYAIGGFDGNVYMSSVQKYQESSLKGWTTVTPMKQARCTHTAVPIFETQQILVFGGFDYVALDTVQKYSVVNDQWQTITKMPKPRFMHCSLLVRQ